MTDSQIVHVVLCYQTYPTGPQTWVDSVWTDRKWAEKEIEKHRFDANPVIPANEYRIQEIRLNTSRGIQ